MNLSLKEGVPVLLIQTKTVKWVSFLQEPRLLYIIKLSLILWLFFANLIVHLFIINVKNKCFFCSNSHQNECKIKVYILKETLLYACMCVFLLG